MFRELYSYQNFVQKPVYIVWNPVNLPTYIIKEGSLKSQSSGTNFPPANEADYS